MTAALSDLTVLILTFNEEANIGRTLQALPWARNVLIIDSQSTDGTSGIVEGYPQAQVLRRAFDSHARQWNFGLDQVRTPWVLTLDADYFLPVGAEQDILRAMEGTARGWRAEFDYLVLGRVVKGSVLPGRTVLFRKDGARYFDDGHTQRLQTLGPCESLPFRIAHDDRKPLRRWLGAQVRYAELEADKLCGSRFADLGLSDRLRRLLVVAPPSVFLLAYVLRGGFLSGWRGLYYALQRFVAETLLSLYLLERLIERKQR